jgi:flagellar biosynthesis/type III secretory pathway protein FliH
MVQSNQTDRFVKLNLRNACSGLAAVMLGGAVALFRYPEQRRKQLAALVLKSQQDHFQLGYANGYQHGVHNGVHQGYEAGVNEGYNLGRQHQASKDNDGPGSPRWN